MECVEMTSLNQVPGPTRLTNQIKAPVRLFSWCHLSSCRRFGARRRPTVPPAVQVRDRSEAFGFPGTTRSMRRSAGPRGRETWGARSEWTCFLRMAGQAAVEGHE